MVYSRTILLVSIFLFSITVKSQSTYVGGLFPTIDHSGRLSKKLNYSIYYFAAFPIVNLKKPDISKDAYFNLLYFEQAMTYRLTDKLFLTGSYLYQRTNVVQTNYVNENRFYIQTVYKHFIKRINIRHRLRFDGRFIQNRVTHETPFTNRLRYLIGIDFTIKNSFYFFAYEEAFFNTYNKASVIYGENWAYAGIGKKLNTKNKIELGLLSVSWNTGVRSWFNQYYLQLTWSSYIDFRKNKE
jgi:hypothetical protein